METSNNIVPFMATHPTSVIKEEIRARGMAKKELAERMGMKTSNLSRLLKGENITPQTASKLEDALGIPAEFWIKMQIQYDKDVKAISIRDENEKEASTLEYMLSSILNLPVLYERMNINKSNFIHKKIEQLNEYLGFKVIDIPKMQFINQPCYKKSDKNMVDERNQNTWLTLAYINSLKNKPEESFQKGNAKKAAYRISEIAHSGNVTEKSISDILFSYGISYSVVEKLDKAPIDAACIMSDGYPAIITTHRKNDMSMLIFNILHELGHIELHLFNNVNSMFVSGDSYSVESKEEKEANIFAEDALINREVWMKMMRSNSYGISTKNIVDKLRMLSKENNLDFNIVAWRYKYESNNYALYGVKAVHIR